MMVWLGVVLFFITLAVGEECNNKCGNSTEEWCRQQRLVAGEVRECAEWTRYMVS